MSSADFTPVDWEEMDHSRPQGEATVVRDGPPPGDTPRTWPSVLERLALTLGSSDPEGQWWAEAEEWIRQACEARWGADQFGLSRMQRQLALQKAIGTVLALSEERGDLTFARGLRGIVREAFARFWDGVAVDGPPWLIDPGEDRPPYRAWLEAHGADFS